MPRTNFKPKEIMKVKDLGLPGFVQFEETTDARFFHADKNFDFRLTVRYDEFN